MGRATCVVCRTEALDDGRVRLILDDAEPGPSGTLQDLRLYTHTEFDRKAFDEVELSDEKLADIGLFIVSRLAAFRANPR